MRVVAVARLAMLAIMMLCISSFSTQADDVDDCGGKDVEISIRGCSALIRQGGRYAELGYRIRALSYLNKGEYKKAVADFNEAIRRSPDKSGAYSGRGTAYYYLKSYKAAIRDFNTALKLKPTDPVAKRYKPMAEKALSSVAESNKPAGAKLSAEEELRMAYAFLRNGGWDDRDFSAKSSETEVIGGKSIRIERTFERTGSCEYKSTESFIENGKPIEVWKYTINIKKLEKYQIQNIVWSDGKGSRGEELGAKYIGDGFYCVSLWTPKLQKPKVKCIDESGYYLVEEADKNLPGMTDRSFGEGKNRSRLPNADAMKRYWKVLKSGECAG